MDKHTQTLLDTVAKAIEQYEEDTCGMFGVGLNLLDIATSTETRYVWNGEKFEATSTVVNHNG